MHVASSKASFPNPFKCVKVTFKKKENYNRNHTLKIHENSKFKKPYSRVVQKYDKKIREELQEELGLNVPINLFKRDLIADDVNKQIVTKPNQ